jgi:arsenate reductase/ArsR family transcriptional regulator
MIRGFLTVSKALSDPARVRVLLMLETGELCLCQIIDLLRLAPSTVSKHMNILYDAGLVERRKEGRWHFFRLAGPDRPPHIGGALDWVLTTLREDAVARQDARKLKVVRSKDLSELAACYRI